MQGATTSHNEPQRATTSHNYPQGVTTTHNDKQRATKSHKEPQRAPRKLPNITILAKFELIEFSLYTLCFVYNKTIISCFYGLLFLFFQCPSTFICQIETSHVSQLLSTIWFNQNNDKL